VFYLLLALPHVLGICALLWIAARAGTNSVATGEAPEGGADGGGGQQPPHTPQPLPPDGGLPLSDAGQPRRRLRVGERLAELYPRRLRRQHEPAPPQRTPQQS
jgi:hypothetical protein